jgi:hypothetical protein
MPIVRVNDKGKKRVRVLALFIGAVCSGVAIAGVVRYVQGSGCSEQMTSLMLVMVAGAVASIWNLVDDS